MAERVGFEPTNTVRCYTLSRRAPSTARPPLHKPQSAPNRRVGLTRALPGPRPAGALRASKIAPAILSNPRTRLGVTHFPGVRLRPLGHLSTRAARVPEAAPAIKSVRCTGWDGLGPSWPSPCGRAAYPGLAALFGGDG